MARGRLVSYGIVVLVAATVGYAVSSAAPSTPRAHSASFVQPESPDALAFGPTGELYVVDPGRDQVLASASPYRKFTDFAGSGIRGFAGDGDFATKAELGLSPDSGIAVASNGTVYIVDSSNQRVRDVLPNGDIETVAGGGTISLAQSPTPALRAKFNPTGVTIGPSGAAYIAAQQGVYELKTGGTLVWIVGKQPPLASWAPWDANPGGQNDFENAIGIAFDREGDLFVSGGGGYGLYERTRSGSLRFVDDDRGPGGFNAAVATGPGDSVLGAAYDISSYGPNGRRIPVANTLSTVLGPMPHPIADGTKDWMFVTGRGVALATDGDIYADAAVGNTISLIQAIARITPDGHTSLVWRGPVPAFAKSI